MATGSKKNQQEASKYTDKAAAALQPKSYSDPFGTFKNGVFTPNLSDVQKQTYANIDTGIGDAQNQLPTQFSVNAYYNNPYYNDTSNLYSSVLNQQRGADLSILSNDLGARDLQGSAYANLMKDKLNQNYDVQALQSNAVARQASANAYQQSYQNAIAKMQGLQSLKGTLQEQMYMPFQTALNYQDAVSNLQKAQANAYGQMANDWWNRKTGFDNYMAYEKANMKIAAAVAKAVLV